MRARRSLQLLLFVEAKGHYVHAARALKEFACYAWLLQSSVCFKHAAARLPELSESANAQSHLDGELYAPGGLALS